jgi:hypothetical protein
VVGVDYRIEVYDTTGCRVARFAEVPLIEATRATADQRDRIRGMLPSGVANLGHGYLIRVTVNGKRFCDARVTRLEPQWGDVQKLILGKYVSFHEVVEFEAERTGQAQNTTVSRAYTGRAVSAIVKDAINRAAGRIHYLVGHGAYPDGAVREYTKFLSRQTTENELEVGGVSAGQWAGAGRIDASSAYATDGATISNLVVDGLAWPDLRLMMIDCEEPELTSHAVERHPEVASWDAARYAVGGYKLRGDEAKAALQSLLDTKGLDFIELNPFRDAEEEFSGRVDSQGRYEGLVYGGGECFNAGLVEKGCAEVFLREEGAFIEPEMALKDFYSYATGCADSIEEVTEALSSYDAGQGVFETLTTLTYMAGGYTWSMDENSAVFFKRLEYPDRIVYFDPLKVSVSLGSDSGELANTIRFWGNPAVEGPEKDYLREASIEEYGSYTSQVLHYGLAEESDADRLVEGLLDDVAYPVPCGNLSFFHGEPGIRVGDLVEVCGVPLRRLDQEVDGEWAGLFPQRLVGRVKAVTHRFSGREVSTSLAFTSPFRSVENPLAAVGQTQDVAGRLYQFRLDDEDVGLDGRFCLG